MAKKQRLPKNRGFGADTGSFSRAEALMRKGLWDAAHEILTTLDDPQSPNEEVLRLLAALYYQAQNFTDYQVTCRRLHLLKPEDAGLTLALGGAYMTGNRTTLALQAFQDFLQQAPHHAKANEIRSVIPKLEELTAKVIEEIGIEADRAIQVARLHELAQLYLQAVDFATGRQISEELLSLHPGYLPARNNLSLMWAMEGHWQEAIAASQEVLSADGENAHALSNLVRYYYLSGQPDEAEGAIGRLRAIRSDKPDVWQKQLEALSFLGDQAAVMEIFQQTEGAEEPLSPLIYHLAAVATMRLGDEKQARRYWEQALSVEPNFDLVRDNLSDLQQVVSQRQSPWAFPLGYWLSPDAMGDVFLLQEAAERDDEEELQQIAQQFLQQHPEVEILIPALLDRGDGAGRQLALNLALLVKQPSLNQALKEFALSRWGSDAMRQQALRVTMNAGLLGKETVRLWMVGQWKTVHLPGYELHEEMVFNHAPEVEKLARQAIAALNSQNWAKAEAPLKQALKLEPTALDMGYNLAIAYERLGQKEEAMALIQDIHQQNPDYPFARIAIARDHLKQGELSQAEALLQPIKDSQRMHYSTFTAFCDIQMELLVAQKDYDGAQSWLEMWTVMDGNRDALAYWRSLLTSPNPSRQLGKDRAWSAVT
jgi:tetratricopeptide (TPR) repeat protein